MATIQNFEDLQVRKLAREFANDIYKISSVASFSLDYK